MNLQECIQRPDQYPVAHIALHAAAVMIPTALYFWTPIVASISIACWGIVILIIGGHGERALGGNLGALGVSLGFGLLLTPFAALGPWATVTVCALIVAALAWLTEYHQNGGDWCGQDVSNFHNRLKGAIIGAALATIFLGVS